VPDAPSPLEATNTPGVYRVVNEAPISFCANPGSRDGLSDTIRTFVTDVDTRTSPPTITHSTFCGQYPRTVGDPAVVTPLPPIPPPEAVFAAAGLPDPAVSISPHNQGLVGLDTWLWYEGDTEVALAPIGLGGWSVSSSMHIVEYCWDVGEGRGGDVVCATRAGSEAAPAQTHIYDHHGAYTVSVSTRWEGTYTLTHPALPAPMTLPLGPGLTLTGTLPYPVIEIEAVNAAG
jgi:hypothetical protein